MATITLNELREHTAKWIYGVEENQEIIVVDEGKPLARIQRMTPVGTPIRNRFLHRSILPGFAELQERLKGGTDSTQIISNARDER